MNDRIIHMSPGSVYIEHVETQNVFPGLQRVENKFADNHDATTPAAERAEEVTEAEMAAGEGDILAALPDSLTTPQARQLLCRLATDKVLDETWQPIALSHAQRGVLASLLSSRLNIDTPWQTFGRLWGMKPETLRTAFNRGMEQPRTGDFLEKVKKSLSSCDS